MLYTAMGELDGGVGGVARVKSEKNRWCENGNAYIVGQNSLGE